MALILADRVKETSTTSGNGVFTLAGAASGFQSFAVIGNTNTTFYCIAGQGTSEWEVGIGTYATSGTTLTRTTVLSNSSATQPSALSFAAGTKDVFVTYPSEKSVNLDASGNATALGTPVAFVGTNITGTATAFTASNVTTNANLTGGVTSVGNAATVVTNANLTGGVTSVGNAATVVTNANLTGGVTSVGNAATVVTNANLTGEATSVGNAATLTNSAVIGKVITGYVSGAGTVAATDTILQAIQKLNGNTAASGFPATTAMVFKQTAAPTGWTKVLTNNDSALRVVTGAASTGGSVAFTTAFASQAVVGTNAASGAYTLATADIPSHSHLYQNDSGASFNANFIQANRGNGNNAYNPTTKTSGGGGSHSHSAAAFTGTAINLAVAYVDVIIATKD